MNIENLIKLLSDSVCIGNIKKASDIAKEELGLVDPDTVLIEPRS